MHIAWSRTADTAMSRIRTAAQSKTGFEMSCQGHGLLVGWPMRVPPGRAWSVDIGMQARGRSETG